MYNCRDIVIAHLASLFTDYRPQFHSRPDGAVLMNLRNASGKKLMVRVIQPEEQSSDVLLNNLVERIRRDLMTLEGPLEEDNVDWFLKRIELQTFVPVNPQRRQRKVVMAGEKLRALAGK
ncbi:DUF3509 domain-containing protein [Pseudomonas sp. ZM24]|uniref:DUF3509 domain-containing protein n=1 Tax=Pseudomonas triclosanedens TaxID=2961893 RepID=UPI0020C41A03|nr:DUF3509 domain-containing protein [Pseudomonas triclosanedens]MCP8471764.1 DUF3509 domain-containing protein [Pseudomonas triclosanedens]MCP8478883.1 DUF3509 domain-containing protein [Pseudomonas triclosanedens]